MTRLFRAELLRLRSRRLTWVVAALLLVVTGLSVLAAGYSMRPITAAEQAEAQQAYQQAVQEYQREYAQNPEDFDQAEADCVASGGSPEDCSSEPRLEWYVPRSTSTFEESTQLVVLLTSAAASLGALLVSASLIGAEYNSGAIGNWLTFVPQRTRVYLTKLLTSVLVAVLGTVALLGLGLLASVVVASVVDVPTDGLSALLEGGGRGLLVVTAAAVVGFGLALLTRHTIAASGVVLGYLILSGVLSLVMGSVPSLGWLQRWLPQNNLLAILLDGHTYVTQVLQQQPDGTFQPDFVEHTISMAQGGVYWAVVVAAFVALGLVVFRSRDLS